MPRPTAESVANHPALPAEALAAWLRQALGLDGELTIERFTRGWSNLTFRVQVGDRRVVVRRGPPGVKIGGAHDMLREARILRGVRAAWPYVPEVLAVCERDDVIGGPFYVMAEVDGVILRADLPRGFDATPERMAGIAGAAIDALAAIHELDLNAAGLAEVGRPDGYLRRQVDGWRRRFAKAATAPAPDIERLGDWLAAHMPPASAATLVHNDFKHDNLVLDREDPTRLVAVLDWEMATVGDPLLDLGTALAWWVDPDDPWELQALRQGPTHLPGNPTRTQVAQRYAERRGQDFDPLWYFLMGLFKNIVVGEQLHARFKAGLSDDPRFEALGPLVRGLGAVGMRAVAAGRMDGLKADG